VSHIAFARMLASLCVVSALRVGSTLASGRPVYTLASGRLAYAARCHPSASEAAEAAESSWLDEVWWENMLTCVEYETGGELRLGVYVSYSVVESEPHIRPLCASAEEEGVSALLCDEDAPSVPLSAVRKVLDPDYVFVSERQAGGGQGLGNPHGEHGEECFDLRDVEVSEDVVVVVREGRDIERVL